jgi:molybdenum cofactor biosynthesis enzyme MoaA
MEFQRLPLSPDEDPVQIISVVADVIDDCNHSCVYCHPMQMGKWGGALLSADQVGAVLRASGEAGVLEVLLTGGEITMHPEFNAIMDQTRDLEGPAVAMVTNATLISPGVVRAIRGSGIARVCVSLDGPDAAMHDPRRPHRAEGDALREDAGHQARRPGAQTWPWWP